MQSSESNPPVKNRSTESVQEPKEEAFPEELMRLARPPKGITVEVKDGVLTIRQRWWAWSPEMLMLLAMTVVMDGLIFLLGGGLLWFNVVVSSEYPSVGLLLLIGLFVVMGANWNHQMARVALNASTLTVNADHLAVTSGPLSPSADFDAPTRSIEQLFITKLGLARLQNGIGRFNVVARLHSGENHVLLEGVHRVEQAKFIEHRLEAFLGIVDKPVDGELAG